MKPLVLGSLPAKCLFAALLVSGAGGDLLGQETIRQEIDVAFAPVEVVRPVLEAAMSPQGRFVLLPNKGSALVIDTPAGIFAAEEAIAAAELPAPEVSLEFQFVTGLPPRRQSLTVAREVPFPTRYAAPQIFVGPRGGFTIVPSTPTKFQRRSIGVTSETRFLPNPDGSITLDINTESTRFDGFIHYGSAILPAGGITTIPVTGAVGDPRFFNQFVDPGAILMPILSTTRISTSVVIRPRVHFGVVNLDVMPRLRIEGEEDPDSDREAEEVDLRQFETVITIPRGETGRVYGFEGADENFNRRFLGAEKSDQGGTAIVVKAKIAPPREGEVSAPGGEARLPEALDALEPDPPVAPGTGGISDSPSSSPEE